MRLRRLLIQQYGNFERLDLPLATEPGRINLVVAPNGAGKSVLRQAFHDLLFGYSSKSKMNFRYSKGLYLEAEAVTRAGEELQFGWRHPGGREFPDPADATAATRFGAALGGIRPPQLENLFALDTARLRAGGEELAQGGDSLGLALLSGTGELMSAKTARADLAARRDTVWGGSRLSSRPLARAAKALEDARKKARGAVQLPVQRAREMSAMEAQLAQLKEARESHAAMQEKASRLARIDRTRRFLEEHRAASDWLAANPDAPVLAASLADALAAARHDVSLATAKHADAQQDLTAAEQAAAAITLDTAALEQEQALRGLAGALKSAEEKSRHAVERQAERRGHLALVAAALQDLGASIPVEQASTVLPRLADVAAARQLIAQHASAFDKHETAIRNLQEAQEALRQLGEAALAPPRSVDALQGLLQVIRADRDPVRHVAETALAARQAKTEAASALALVPGCTDTAAARTLAMPLEASFERLDDARSKATTTLRERDSERNRLAGEREAWARELQDLQARPLPDDNAIALARAQRDAGWRLIYRRAFTPAPPDPAEERAYAGDEPLPLVFERHLRAADDLADQRLTEVQRIEAADRLTRALSRTAPEWEQLTVARNEARQALQSAQAAFGAACSELGLDQGATLADIRHVLTRRAAAIAASIRADEAHDEHESVLAAHAAWAAQLRELLHANGEQSFAALVVAADSRLKAEADAKTIRVQHETNRRNADRTLAKAQADVAEAEAALTAWQQRWAACLSALGRPANEMPAVTEAVLQCLSGLAAADSDATALAKRIDDMNADVAAFTESVATLARQLGIPPDADSFAMAHRLIARHDAARTQRTRWQEADEALRQRRAALTQAAERERDARRALDAIIAACGATDGDDAERRIAASRERARQEAIRDAAASGLSQHGEGLSLAELQADADSVTADQAAAERGQTQAALAAARDVSEKAAGAANTLEQTLNRAATATDLSESVRSQEGAAATFSRLLDDYLVLALAEQMLAQSVADVEAKAGSNGVSRIAAAFARVTNDDYTIDSEEGPDQKTILMAIEQRWPDEKKHLAQLSEGTRDQLYLALRIVAIEDHAAAAPPLPFLADDILQTFDDSRALAALQALLALSQHTQVIVLTHHPHLAVLAGSLPPGSVHLPTL